MNRDLANSRRNWTRRWPVLLLLLPLALAACTPSPPFRFRGTFTLSPSADDISFWYHYESDNTDPLGTCGVGVFGTKPPDLASGQALVGFSNSYDPGTQPLPCEESLSEVYRGVVRFDLSSVRKIKGVVVESANFNYRVVSSVFCSSAGGRCVTDRRNCVSEVLAATVDVRGRGSVPGDVPAGDSYRFGSGGDVSSLVRDWVTGARPNFGFVLKGPDETYATNNAACYSTLSGFTLTVKVIAP